MSFELKVGKGKMQVNIEAHLFSDGLSVSLFGGDKPHIGAVALSIPRKSLKDKKSISCSTSILTVTGHKDDVIVKEMSEAISKAANITVTVVAGIHIDNAGKKDIEQVMRNCRKASQKLIELVKNKR